MKEESKTLDLSSDRGAQESASTVPSKGINWSGPSGFWIMLTLVVGAAIVLGLYVN
jgi:hypothetical protein